MALEKDKSDIAESFKNLLKKADEMALEQNKDDYMQNSNLTIDKLDIEKVDEANYNNDRLGIKSIKRIPENPFQTKQRIKTDEYISKRKELIIKLSIILNKHIHYWLQKEMPKFSKIQLKKHISNLLNNLQK